MSVCIAINVFLTQHCICFVQCFHVSPQKVSFREAQRCLRITRDSLNVKTQVNRDNKNSLLNLDTAEMNERKIAG